MRVEAGARLIMEFSGRHIVVTGGTGALGAAVVARWSRRR